MLHWTLSSLLQQRGPALAAAAGIALALLLALYLDAVFRGEADQIVAFQQRMPADVWVLQGGVENLHMTRSRLSEQNLADLRAVSGVREIVAIQYQAAYVGPAGRERLAYVIGLPADAPQRGAWALAAGDAAPAPGRVVVPRAIATAVGARLGGVIEIGGHALTVGGLSLGTMSMANPVLFADAGDALRIFDRRDGASLALVHAQTGIDATVLAGRIDAEVRGVEALPHEQLIANDHALALEMGGALVRMMSLIGMGLAALIVLFSAYAFTSAHRAELAVAKALGAPRYQLLASAALQTGVVTLAGALLAVLALWPLGAMLEMLVPEVAVHFSPVVALRLGALALLLAELAAVVPAAQIARLDPAQAFQG